MLLSQNQRSKKVSTYLFVIAGTLPTFSIVFVLHIFPVFQGMYTSLFRWSGLSQRKIFVGLDNYIRLLDDEIVWKALANDLYIVFFKILFTMSLALLFSGILAFSLRKWGKLFQGFFFFPNFLSVAIVAIIFSFVYNPSIGILNQFLKLIGMESLSSAWLGDPNTALNAVLFPTIWAAVGYQMIIIRAGIVSIPETFFEVARLEGASKMWQFFHIVLPLIRNVLKTCLALMVINTLNQTFIFVRVMTNGGPNYATEVLGTYMYFQAFENFKFGYGTAIAIINFILSITLTVLITKVMKREDVEYA